MDNIDNSGRIISPLLPQSLMTDLHQIIGQARGRVASQVNSQLTLMYWHVGERINREVLGGEKAEYGKQIVATLSRQLSWSHFVEVIPLKDELQREFYITLAASERWGVRQLRKQIDSMLYERTAIASKPDELIKKELAELRDNNVMSPDLVFKSPYFLEFTGLTGMYSERDFEDSLIAHLEQFIIELGCGFCFVDRQSA